MCGWGGWQIYGLIWFCLHPIFTAEGQNPTHLFLTSFNVDSHTHPITMNPYFKL